MRIPNELHLAGPWRIHEIAPDFVLEDAWALPVHGRAQDFDLLLDAMTRAVPGESLNLPARVLWGVRDLLGKKFGIGEISAAATGTGLSIPGSSDSSLSERLPVDLRGTTAGLDFSHLPFEPVFRTADEFAAELSNATVHAVMHLVWVPDRTGTYQGRMGVYVCPRGRFGRAYLAFIKPFRYAIVYPAMMRAVERRWAQLVEH